jgi:iron complex transport system ATP-binding protein
MEVALMGRYPLMGRFQTESAMDRAVAREAMRRTETEAFADRTVTTLSGGERQRVIVARALAQEARILLLDEPTANLDVQHQLKVLDIVREMTKGQGLTAIAALHDLSLAARYCDRLVLLSGGRVLADGAPAAVLTADNMERAFHVHAVVFPDPFTGAPTVSLLEPSSAQERRGKAQGRVHVLCGGGTGARLLYHLSRAGFTVTVGPLGAGDSDRSAADILGIDYVPVAAFIPADAAALARHAQLVREADAVVVSDVPFGPGNVHSLDALVGARRLVHVSARSFGERDFTGGEASRILSGLPAALRCRTEEEAVQEVIKALGADKDARTQPGTEV